MLKRWLKIALKSLIVLIALVLVAGTVYEQLSRRRDRARLPQIGASYDIGGRSLNLFCSGSGTPTVILESASGIGLEFQPAQTEIAKFTRACWYDRAGMGWSDPGPFPRTASALADDLHALLHRAGVTPPYVLAGYSYAGLPMRVFAGRYTSEVAGMVLIDTTHEDEPLRAPRFYLARTAPRYLWHPIHIAFESAAFVGLVRLTQSPRPPDRNADRDVQPTLINGMTSDEILSILRIEPAAYVAANSTGVVSPESYAEAAAAPGIGDRPLLVLTAGKPFDFGDPELNRQAAAYQQIWVHEIQPKLLRLSSDSRQIVVPNANHGSMPQELVISSIREVVTEVRGGAAPH